MTELWFKQWRDEQGLGSRYPFADSANLTDTSGAVTIGIDTFIDAAIYPIGGLGRMYISSALIDTNQITLTISDETGTARCSGSFNPTTGTAENIVLADNYGRPAGILLSSPLALAAFTAWNLGTYKFALGTTEFVAGVTIPTPEVGLRGVLTEAGELITGDVWLVGDQGIVVRQDTDGAIRIDLVGDPLFARVLCQPINLFQSPLFLQTINGCPPDEYGNFNLTVGDQLAADTILRITPTASGLQINAVGQLIQGNP